MNFWNVFERGFKPSIYCQGCNKEIPRGKFAVHEGKTYCNPYGNHSSYCVEHVAEHSNEQIIYFEANELRKKIKEKKITEFKERNPKKFGLLERKINNSNQLNQNVIEHQAS